MLIYGLWARMPHFKMQYEYGYIYARDHLTPKLDSTLVRRPQRLVLPDIDGDIRWDPEKQKFIPIPIPIPIPIGTSD
jgi:hypothetical protein